MPDPLGLAELQRWMQRAMLDPDGLPADVEQVVTASARLSARERLAVYWRGYRLRLVEAMRGFHPAACHLLGRELFDRFALDFLDARPSRSRTLFRLADGFAEHVEATQPDTGGESWPDLVIDLLRFERAVNDALDAPDDGCGGVEVPDDPMRPDLVLRPAPGLGLIPARFPVHEYTLAVHRGEDPPIPAPRPSLLAVARRDGHVVTREVGPGAFRALRALASGTPVGTALGDVDPKTGRAWLRDWVRARLFTAIDRPDAGGAPPDTTHHTLVESGLR
ncbi:hypothetical protein GCM10011581_28890 [Saccharopolyspora subtropica]|uniref:Putative DNA-binding domain-containing protein n=1 Tax=Saccharopolyspora thermophila TaxID=89367 RepID=A0A917JW72_9PSEU|nr:DNA-binding domain-containing protein [Saccharopolyspora subtropica]GGI90011.1 hypothetical protein GCM10011581_28890 [Saccharopolyspora subtropica]